MDTTEAARAIAALRKKQEGICPVCGRTFSRPTRAVYCSRSRTLKAQYRRRKERAKSDKLREEDGHDD